jgi:hypothetical protein
MYKTIPVTAKVFTPPFTIIKIIASHTPVLEAVTTPYIDLLDYATLCTSYENAINLACTLYSRENLSIQFTILVIETEDLILRYNSTIT